MANKLRMIEVINDCKVLSVLTDTLNQEGLDYQLSLKFSGTAWVCSFRCKSKIYSEILRRLRFFEIDAIKC